jgi:hypothetical protein
MPALTNPLLAVGTAGGINTSGYGTIATLNGAGSQPRQGQFVVRFQF